MDQTTYIVFGQDKRFHFMPEPPAREPGDMSPPTMLPFSFISPEAAETTLTQFRIAYNDLAAGIRGTKTDPQTVAEKFTKEFTDLISAPSPDGWAYVAITNPETGFAFTPRQLSTIVCDMLRTENMVTQRHLDFNELTQLVCERFRDIDDVGDVVTLFNGNFADNANGEVLALAGDGGFTLTRTVKNGEIPVDTTPPPSV